jgi:hypothetical protein
MRRKDPNKMATKKQRERMRRKDPNKTLQKTAGADEEERSNGNKKSGADEEEGPK